MSDAPRPPGRFDPEPPSSLLQDLRDGKPEAWPRLLLLYAPVVRRWLRRHGLQDADADDVLQDVFRAVANHVGTFRRDRGSGSFVAWLATVTRTKVSDAHRRHAGQPAAEGGSDNQQRLEQQPAPIDDSSSGVAAVPERHLLLRRALDLVRAEFEPQTWQAFWATVIDGRATQDVATELSVKPGAVRTARSRVLRRVRAVFAEMAG